MANSDTVRLSGLSVLVVEDELMVAMLLEDMLSELGAKVVGPVNSAEKAMRLLATQKVDAATLDINLKEGFVYDAAATLRARDIPFVFVTGYGDLPDCPLELRDTPRLKKPFRMADLGRTVVSAISGG